MICVNYSYFIFIFLLHKQVRLWSNLLCSLSCLLFLARILSLDHDTELPLGFP